jgi:hypothetical protein
MNGSGKAVVLAVGKNTLFEHEKTKIEKGDVSIENANISKYFQIAEKTSLQNKAEIL